MSVSTISLQLNTKGNADIIDITAAVHEMLAKVTQKNGILTIFCPSSTSALTTIEYEPGCVADLRHLFETLVPQGRAYQHEQAWHDGNGHSHMRAALLGPSLTVPFVDGRMTLGTWQQIIYVDFDVRARRRELVVQVMGE
ncbi:MAG: secondary thiamine-phosphate synthase enzyme YjbQ [Chloroflexota bacterium]